ncbi:FkbM family methyltransferase [Arundinibacter roseus]|uniref:FkbM family methyltransferase n=1 Tax=Arundinibacter roseus TaxID=2070510 RepID=A0A4R4K357_9BACT|nr:FkbM family methyltransferase [Arundinibacter roseus]TDB61794.1 FkbM family methyltransferase [Arundinibacter roseus]
MQLLKKAIQKILFAIGYKLVPKISRKPGLSIGQDLIQLLEPISAPKLIFDVGAHKGESHLIYRKVFPQSTIYSFEPDPETFKVLRANTANLPAAILENAGVGAAEERLPFYINKEDSMGNSFLKVSGQDSQPFVEVPVHSLDSYTKERTIQLIDFLKIDTQGFDLEVLKGAENLLKNGQIKVIQFEAMLEPYYHQMPTVGAHLDFLLERGYKMVGMYNCHRQQAGIDWADFLFIHPSVQERIH